MLALGGPNESDPARRVAGVLSGMSKGHGNSGWRLPFYWWEAPGGSAGATCAVRPSVAAVFLACVSIAGVPSSGPRAGCAACWRPVQCPASISLVAGIRQRGWDAERVIPTG
ncbi:DUF6416 domain-containing protein [Streptomyces sp. NPDC007206]|uniref:DUF6416 domain-containing protein n=1 Tax=Streptomyces sp. NPDC007206 TaxID=3154317 RepID=UPI0033C15A3B